MRECRLAEAQYLVTGVGTLFYGPAAQTFPNILSLSLSLSHTHTHTVGASQRGKLAASHRVSIEKGEWISEEIVYCKRRVFIASARGQNRGDPQGKKKRTGGNNQLHKEPIVRENSLN
jgi:hypothetical protein